MNCPPPIRLVSRRGSALVISLLMIVVLTVVILTVTVQSQLERQLSAAHLAEQQAQQVAQMGLDTALSLIRETLAPFDDPFGATTQATNFWSLSPGRIDLFDFAPNAAGRPNRARTVELHSGYPVANTNDAANLNAADSYGHRPVWSENRKMEVDWISVGKDPTREPGTNNPVVGRFAFWVDDEGSKINVNTADGSDNYTLSSYGQGTPTAVSLSVFSELGDPNAPDREMVRAIAQEARRLPFANPAEMATRKLSLTHPVTGAVTEKSVSPKFPATNAFNFTTYSRSPDFNIFNLPKFQLIPSNVDSLSQLAGSTNFMAVNRMIQYPQVSSVYYYTSITGAQSSLRSLYPTPRQLTGAWTNVWPLMPNYPPMDGGVQLVTSENKMNAHGGNFSLNQINRFEAMRQMALYLVGTNALNQPINWPFRDANYLEKYKNLRQIDSIILQIFEMPRNAAMRAWSFGSSVDINNDGLINPSILPYGLLGTNAVGSAVGRYPRLTRVLAKVELAERDEAFPLVTNGVYFPGIQTNSTGVPIIGTGYADGADFRMNIAFSQYIPRHLYDHDNVVDGQIVDYNNQWEQVHQTRSHIGWSTSGGLNEMDGDQVNSRSALNPASLWMDTLMSAEAYNSNVGYFPAGIDFRANRSSYPDPDARAADYRRFEYKTVTRRSNGTNGVTSTNVSLRANWATGWHPDFMGPLLRIVAFVGASQQINNPFAGVSQNFSQNSSGNGTFGSMSGALNMDFPTRNWPESHAVVERLRLRGGVTAQVYGQARMGLTAVDAIRGPLSYSTNWASSVVPPTTESITNLTKAVAPIFTSNPGGAPLEVELNKIKYIVAKVRDPLVGQLPGDWLVEHFTPSVGSLKPGTNSTTMSDVFRVDANGASRANITWPLNNGTGNSNQFDFRPEPEWVDMAAESGAVILQGSFATNNHVFRPYMEGDVQRVQVASGVSGLYVNLSRQRSFPSVGHLQYLRTGAMPDDENAQIGDAKYAGMPFRCLNFGPLNTQGGIPDWAMLDLFTVPNAIWTRPSSRLAYPQLGINETNRPELIQLTYGGASSGKINLNGSVLWPWAEDDTNYVRPKPLAAQFNGLRYNTNGVVNRTLTKNSSRVQVTTSPSSWSVLDAPQALSLAEAIAAYILQRKEPLAMPGQVCDIPAVNAKGAQIPTTKTNGDSLLPPNDGFYAPGIPSPDGFNRTRNDIVSQSIGNLVTQGNVFAVWVVGESIRKSPTTDPTQFVKDQDRVGATSRFRFIVERKLDPGVDGIYGNSAPGRAGTDGIVGTPDDRCDAGNAMDELYHPPNPKFIYQVIQMQAIQ